MVVFMELLHDSRPTFCHIRGIFVCVNVLKTRFTMSFRVNNRIQMKEELDKDKDICSFLYNFKFSRSIQWFYLHADLKLGYVIKKLHFCKLHKIL